MAFDDKQKALIEEFADLAKDLDQKLDDPVSIRRGINMLRDIEIRAKEDGEMPDLVEWTQRKLSRAQALLRIVEKDKKPYRK